MLVHLKVTASSLTALVMKARWPLALALPGTEVLALLKKLHNEQRFLLRLLQMAWSATYNNLICLKTKNREACIQFF